MNHEFSKEGCSPFDVLLGQVTDKRTRQFPRPLTYSPEHWVLQVKSDLWKSLAQPLL